MHGTMLWFNPAKRATDEPSELHTDAGPGAG